MKKKELQELKDRSVEELAQKEQDLFESLFRLRLQMSTGQLEKPSRLREVRRDIARVKTFLRQRELGGGER